MGINEKVSRDSYSRRFCCCVFALVVALSVYRFFELKRDTPRIRGTKYRHWVEQAEPEASFRFCVFLPIQNGVVWSESCSSSIFFG